VEASLYQLYCVEFFKHSNEKIDSNDPCASIFFRLLCNKTVRLAQKDKTFLRDLQDAHVSLY